MTDPFVIALAINAATALVVGAAMRASMGLNAASLIPAKLSSGLLLSRLRSS